MVANSHDGTEEQQDQIVATCSKGNEVRFVPLTPLQCLKLDSLTHVHPGLKTLSNTSVRPKDTSSGRKNKFIF